MLLHFHCFLQLQEQQSLLQQVQELELLQQQEQRQQRVTSNDFRLLHARASIALF